MVSTAATVQAPKRRWVRWVKRILMGAISLVALVILSGITYEWLATRAENKRYPQQGHSVDVGGFRLNIDCSGTSQPGAPTVILESGAGVPGFGWALVQPDIAKFVRVCSYDRAAYGWSDPPLEMKRTSLQSTKELHALLKNASVPPPYVLVGHSLGGFNIRVYNQLYPDEVVGAVFVDSSHPDQLANMPASLKQYMDKNMKSMEWMKKLAPIALDTGVVRLMLYLSERNSTLPKDFVEEMAYLQRRKDFLAVGFAEMDNFNESADETRNSGNFGDKPVLVLTAGKFPAIPGIPSNDVQSFQNRWTNELQPQLAQLSTRGKQLVVADSTHMIPMERPAAVVEAVREIVQASTKAQQ
jgi:pimeloyl-ACP methyl ester carboxylesterase